MTFQNRYDYCMKKFINIDVGFAGIILYPFVSLGCYIYAFVLTMYVLRGPTIYCSLSIPMFCTES